MEPVEVSPSAPWILVPWALPSPGASLVLILTAWTLLGAPQILMYVPPVPPSLAVALLRILWLVKAVVASSCAQLILGLVLWGPHRPKQCPELMAVLAC